MIDDVAVRAALRAVLLTVSGLPSAIAWENRKFQPPNNAPWVRETYLPGIEFQSANDLVQGDALVQYDVIFPAGSGTETAEALANDIKAAFKPANAIGPDIGIVRSERDPGRTEDDIWYVIPVRITWRAFSFN